MQFPSIAFVQLTMASVGHKKKVTNAMRRFFAPDQAKDHQNNNPTGAEAAPSHAAVNANGAAGGMVAGPSAGAKAAGVQSPFKRRW